MDGLLDGGFLGGKRKEGRGKERGRKGRFARSIEGGEGGMEEERREVSSLSCRCCITRRRRMGEKNERKREREKKQEQPRGRNAEAAALRLGRVLMNAVAGTQWS